MKRDRRGYCYDAVDYEISRHATPDQDEILKICVKLAQKSNMSHKHGCVIVKNGAVIGSGYNMQINGIIGKGTSPLTPKPVLGTTVLRDICSLHAEIAAIRNTKKDLMNDSEMYVVRIGPQKLANGKTNGLYGLYSKRYSKPCVICESKIIKSKIKRVFYSINE